MVYLNSVSFKPVRFGGLDSDPLQDPKLVRQEMKQTVQNSQTATDFIDRPHAPSKRIEETKKTVTFQKTKWWQFMSIPALIACISGPILGYAAYKTEQRAEQAHVVRITGRAEMEKLHGKAEIKVFKGINGEPKLGTMPKSEYEYQQAVTKADNATASWRTNLYFLGVIFTGSLSVLGLGGGVALLRLRKLVQEAQEADQNTLFLKPDADPVSQRVSQVLENQINNISIQFSDKIRDLYANQPGASESLNAIFGSMYKLPSSEGVRKLFDYFALQLIASEETHRIAKGPAMGEMHPMTQRDFLEKVYTIAKIAQETGKLMTFVESKPEASLLGQQFNPLVVPEIIGQETENIQRLEKIETLVKKEMDTEKHLALAQEALTTAKLGNLKTEQEIGDLTKLVTEFDTKLKQVRAELFQDDTPTQLTDRDLMTDLKVDHISLVSYLNSVLEADREQAALKALVQAKEQDERGQGSDLQKKNS